MRKIVKSIVILLIIVIIVGVGMDITKTPSIIRGATDEEQLLPPKDVDAIGGINTITISWKENEGVKQKYNIYIDGFIRISSMLGTKVTIENLSEGDHTVCVESIYGSESVLSDIITVYVYDNNSGEVNLIRNTWTSFFSNNGGMFGSTVGELVSNLPNSWTVDIETLGIASVWAGQVYQKNTHIKAGKTYTLSFKMISSNIDHYVYLKIAGLGSVAYRSWVELEAGKTNYFNVTFIANCDANAIYFGVGGDSGNGEDASPDEDAAIKYSILPNYKEKLSGIDGSAATRLQCSDIILKEYRAPETTTENEVTTIKESTVKKPAKVKIGKVSSPAKKKLSVKWKKVKKISGYEMYISSKKNFKSYTFKRTYKAKTIKTTIRGLKSKKKYFVKIRAYKKVGKKKYYGAWSKVKSVKIK